MSLKVHKLHLWAHCILEHPVMFFLLLNTLIAPHEKNMAALVLSYSFWLVLLRVGQANK